MLISPDKTPPTASFNPADEATNVAVSSDISVIFNEPIQRGVGNIYLKLMDGTLIAVYDAATSSNLSFTSTTLTINPTADLLYSTSYKVELSSGVVTDLAGNGYGGTTSYNFTTVAAPVLGYSINATAVFWKNAVSSSSPINLAGVTLAEGGAQGTTDLAGKLTLTGVHDNDGADDGNMTLAPQLDAPGNAKSAITLTDVLAALKVYLNKPLPDSYSSPLNYVAADFDGSGTVTLTDVLQLLKYYLNKSTTVSPTWQFVDAADMSADGKTFTGANGANLAKDNTTPHVIDQTFDSTHTSIQLVGVLRGDVDGSWTA